MGQAGAQREPSMEEILASIRKIIETNDKTDRTANTPDTASHPSRNDFTPGHKTVASDSHANGAAGSVDNDDDALIDDADEEARESSAALQSDMSLPAAHRPISQQFSDDDASPKVASAKNKSAQVFQSSGRASPANDITDADQVTLADIAARMRGGDGVAVGTVRGEQIVRELPDTLVGDLSVEDAKLSLKSIASREAADGLEEVAKELARIEEEKSRAEQKLAALKSSEIAAKVAVSGYSEPDHEDFDLDDGDSDLDEGSGSVASDVADALTDMIAPEIERQLISVDASEKVAQSFAALDAVMASGAQRNFDEIAEDLLRPMLQNWLDDNLPTLVERLVREEIERVSRGNRR